MKFLCASILIIALCAGASGASASEAGVLAPFEKRVLETPAKERMTTYVRSGEGPVLVLVPGTWGDVHRFTPLIARLPQETAIAVVELSWQGGHVPSDLELSIESVTDDVLWAVEELALGPFVLGGHSIGGMVAVEAACREIPALQGLIPMEGWTHHTVVQTAFDGVVTAKLPPILAGKAEESRARGLAHLSDEQRSAIARIWREWNGYECLEHSDVPMLQIWGDRGKARPDRKALQVPERQTIEIAWAPGASHALLLEAPDAVAKAVTDFIERLESR